MTLSLFKEVLDQGPPGAIIAGGAIRDLFFGKSFKDIDVFYVGDGYTWPESFTFAEGPKWTDYGDLHSVVEITNLKYKGNDVQVMRLTEHPIPYVYQFDIDLCKAYYDGGLYYTEDFVKDAVNKTLTINGGHGKRAVERANRINEKYNFIIKEPDYL